MFNIGDRIKTPWGLTGTVIGYEDITCDKCDLAMQLNGTGLDENGNIISFVFSCPQCGKLITRQDIDFRIKWDQPIEDIAYSEEHPAYLIKISRLVKRYNKKTKRTEYALASRSDPSKILRWFGKRKPSKERVTKEERRVQFFKHQ